MSPRRAFTSMAFLAIAVASVPTVLGQTSSQRLPRAVTPKPKTAPKAKPKVYTPSTYQFRSIPKGFPWKRNITATIFWIGEQPTANNPTPNCASSWDTRWQLNYGGYDDPNPARRTVGYRPVSFVPGQNPFYVALPYNDVDKHGTKAEARRVIPWFKERYQRDGKTVLKGQWLVIRHKDRFCFAQWEDCGPFVTDDWQYVFGRARPRNTQNKSAGIDLSPAVRDYLRIKSGAKVDWRFVSTSQVRPGPWKHYGSNNHFVKNRTAAPPKPKPTIEDLYEARANSMRRSRQSSVPVTPRG